MKVERTIKTDLFRLLRRMGMLCKKPVEPKKRLRIARTVYPEHRVSSIDAERAVWVENKKRALNNCMFNTDTGKCKCGIKSVDDFAIKGCKK